MGAGIYTVGSLALVASFYSVQIASSNPLVMERKGKYTLYKEDITGASSILGRDDPGVWPWPANKSSIVDAASTPDMPSQNLTLGTSPFTTQGQISKKFIEKKCDAGKKFKIEEAWKEAKLLATAQTTTVLGYNYDIPHTQWLGKDWNSDSWSFWKWDYRSIISKNMVRSFGIYTDNAPQHDYIYWYCYDYSGECTDATQAYSWDEEGLFWSNHYTVFCDKFYERKTLADQIKKHANNKHEQKVMENFHLNRGQIMFHETWHYQYLVSDPRAKDYAYQAQAVWDLAKNPKKGTNWAYVNADSYALDGVAIYVQQHYKSSMSPVPFRELKNFDAEAAAAVSAPAPDDATAKTFDGRPPNWVGPSSTSEQPDLSIWEQVNDDSQTAAVPTPSVVPFNPSDAPPDQPTGGPPTTATCQTFNDCLGCPTGQCPACSATWSISIQNPG